MKDTRKHPTIWKTVCHSAHHKRIIVENAFINRSTQGVSVLLYIHNIYKRSLGGRKDIGYILARISGTSRWGIWTLYPNWHIDSQLWEGTHWLSA